MTETDLRIKMAEAKGYAHDVQGWCAPGECIWWPDPPPLGHWCWGCVVELAAAIHKTDGGRTTQLTANDLVRMLIAPNAVELISEAWLKVKGLA